MTMVMYFLWLGGCIEFLIIILVFRMGVVKRIVPRSQLKIKKKTKVKVSYIHA